MLLSIAQLAVHGEKCGEKGNTTNDKEERMDFKLMKDILNKSGASFDDCRKP